MTEPYWVRVVAPHFVAGLAIKDERCIKAAPILRWAIGKPAAELFAYFRKKNWEARPLLRSMEIAP